MKKYRVLLLLPLLLLGACDDFGGDSFYESSDIATHSVPDGFYPVTGINLQLGKSSIWDVEGYTTCSATFEPGSSYADDLTFTVSNATDPNGDDVASYKYGHIVLNRLVDKVTNLNVYAYLRSNSGIKDRKTLEVKPFIINSSSKFNGTINKYSYEMAYTSFYDKSQQQFYCVIDSVNLNFNRYNNGIYNGTGEISVKFRVYSATEFRTINNKNQNVMSEFNFYNVAVLDSKSNTLSINKIFDTSSATAGGIASFSFPYQTGDYFEYSYPIELPLNGITDSYQFRVEPTNS